MYTYLLINLLTIAVPLALSFERRIHYVRKWKYVFLSSFLSTLVFLPWDYVFTKRGIWGFNQAYLAGIDIASLPFEEILFFITVPFSCIFIYELVKLFTRDDLFCQTIRPFLFTLIISSLIIAVFNRQKAYTFWNFAALSGLLVFFLVFVRDGYFGRFTIAYIITLVPFFFVNGILTNGLSFIDSGPVVWYNNRENLGVRFGGIPVEDFAYWAVLFLLNVIWYEYLQKKAGTER